MNLGWILGYRQTKYKYPQDYARASFLPAAADPCDLRRPLMTQVVGFNPVAVPNLMGTPFYLLEIEDYNNNNPVVVHYNCDSEFSSNIKNIIAKVPNTASFESVIFEDSSDHIWKTRRYFGPVRIKRLSIRLLDDNGQIVDLNEGAFIVTLEVETLNMPYKNMVSR